MRIRGHPLSVRYSFRQAVEEQAFDQLPLLNARKFAEACKQRGIVLGISFLKPLEDLDRGGALRPVLFETGPNRELSFQRPPVEPWFSEEHAFEEWSAIGQGTVPVDQFDSGTPRPYYSHWQLLYAVDAWQSGEVSIPLQEALSGTVSLSVKQREWLEWRHEQWSTLDAHWRGAVLILTRIQDRFGPGIKGSLTHASSTMVFDSTVAATVDPWDRERTSFVAADVLNELGLQTEDVAQLHDTLCRRARGEDPLWGWFPLPRMAPAAQRAKLAGAALRAQDAYDAADMLRRFYFHLTEEYLPTADSNGGDPAADEFKRRRYGEDAWPTLSFGYDHLVAELRRLRLWPHLVHVVVEGESEDRALRRILREVVGDADPKTYGLTISVLAGVGNLQVQREVFSLARTAAQWTLLICDREGKAGEHIEALRREDLFDEDAAIIWDRSFEEDSFTVEEIVEELHALARERGVELILDAGAVQRDYGLHRDRADDPKGLAEFILGKARNPTAGSLVVSKPDLAERLAERMLREWDELGQDAAANRRRFLAAVIGMLSVT